MDIASQRLHNQHITRPRRGSPADLVGALGAVQAQEYAFAKWAVALRLASQPTEGEIEASVDCGDILRTHVLHPTWHFVAASDRLDPAADARYLGSHGPATVRDFVWWSSLTTADVRRGLDIVYARA